MRSGREGLIGMLVTSAYTELLYGVVGGGCGGAVTTMQRLW